MGVPSPVWGPLRGTETKRVGAHAAVVSMVVTPTIPSALVQHLNDEVLLKVRPHPDDTVRTLQERIARMSFFDDFRVLHVKGGSTVRAPEPDGDESDATRHILGAAQCALS